MIATMNKAVLYKVQFKKTPTVRRSSKRADAKSDFCLEISKGSCSYLVRLFLQQALAATVGGAVLHLTRVALLKPRRHQTPPHRCQHALVHRGVLSNTDKAKVNYRSHKKKLTVNFLRRWFISCADGFLILHTSNNVC